MVAICFLILKCFYFMFLNLFSTTLGEMVYGMCGDPSCSVIVGKGVTIHPYRSPDGMKLSFKPNENVEIYGKEFGPKKNLLGVSINGVIGFVPNNFIKETATLKRNLVSAVIQFNNPGAVSVSHVVTDHVQHSSHMQSPGNLVTPSFPNQNIQVESSMSSESLTNYKNAPDSLLSSGVANTQIEQQMGGTKQAFSGVYTHTDSHEGGGVYSDMNTHIQPQMGAQAFIAPESSSHVIPSASHSTNIGTVPQQQEQSLQSSHFQGSFQNVESMRIQNIESSYSRDTVQPNILSSHNSYSEINSRGDLLDSTGTMQVSSPYFHTQSIPQPQASFPSQIHQNAPNSEQFNRQDIAQSNVPLQNDISSSASLPKINADNLHYSKTFQSHSVPQGHSSVSLQDQKYSHYNEFSSRDIIHSNVHASSYASSMSQTQNIDHNDPMQTSAQHLETLHQAHASYLHRSLEYADYLYDVPKRMGMMHQMGADYVDGEAGNHPSYSSQNLQQNPNLDTSFVNPVPSQLQYSPSQHIEASFSDSNVNLQTGVAIEDNKIEFPERTEMSSQNVYQVPSSSSLSINNDVKPELGKNFDNGSIEREDSQGIVEDPGEEEEDEEDEYDNEIDADEQNLSDSDDLTLDSMEKENLEISNIPKEMGDFSNIQELQNAHTSDAHIVMSDAEHMMPTVIKDANSIMPTLVTDANNNLHTKLPKELNTYSQTEGIIESSSIDHLSQNAKQMQYIQQVDDPSGSQIPSNILPESMEKLLDIDGDQESNLFNTKKESINLEKSNDTNSELSEDQNSKVDRVLNIPDLDESDNNANSYQIRNLKGEEMVKSDQNSNSEVGNDENTTQSEFNPYVTFENGLEVLRSFLETVMLWIPEPLYTMIIDLDRKGIPPRVPVFTAISAVPCIFLVIAVVLIKERSKENKLSAQLVIAEKNVFTLSAENNVLEEKLENAEAELAAIQVTLEEERNTIQNLKKELSHHVNCLAETKSQLESSILENIALKETENEYHIKQHEYEKEKNEYLEQKESFEKQLKDQEITIVELSDQLQEAEKELNEMRKEKQEYLQSKEDYEEKLTQLQQNCNQLLQEAEVWNMRINELNMKLSEEIALKEEINSSLKVKDEEIESLKLLVETLKSFDEVGDSEAESRSKEEKMQSLISSSSIMVKLQKQEEENVLLCEKLSAEKSRILDMEVEILEAKSEIDKLKLSYNQALQDKAEAQTKLDVLTNYFKDKEIQLQKQLGAQEAVRQQKEEDASSAERRILLIEQENASYKYQVASMKQEMEETERNLKSQIAVQEKKAHENWIAARAAERKLEDLKQEVTQLRQKLTLLEREQENWVNSSRDDIIRPVPKRLPGLSDDTGISQDINPALDMRPGMFPPQFHDRMPPPMMLPPDRPLPPLPPPPPHIPPFLPHLEPPFRPQPWHIPPDSGPGSDFRTTPPEFLRGRESTPPRGRPSNIIDGDMGPHASSPLGTDTRDSRNSTPPHSLPDFHDMPPQPPRPFFHPPPHHSRFPLPPPFRRDIPQGPKRLDNQGEYSSSAHGAQQSSVPQERWPNSNTRV